MLVEMVNNGNTDATFNPYLIATYVMGAKNGSSTCPSLNNSTLPNPFFTSWSQVKASFPTALQTVASLMKL
jgi:hypothetical protein